MKRLARWGAPAAVALAAFGVAIPVLADPAAPRGVTFSVAAGQAFDGRVAVYRNAGKEETFEDDTAVIDWGDGKPTSQGTLVALGVGDDHDVEVRGSHTYAAPGSYAVTVTIDDPEPTPAIVATSTAKVTGPPPTPNLVFQTPKPKAHQKVVLDAGGSTAAAGSQIVKYEWDINGNGSYEMSTGGSPLAMVEFGEPGKHAVGVKVTDATGAEALTQVQVLAQATKFEKKQKKATLKGQVDPFLSPTVGYGTAGTPPTIEKLPEPECPKTLAIGVAEAVNLDVDGCFTPVRVHTPMGDIFKYGSRTFRLNGITMGGGIGPLVMLDPLNARIKAKQLVKLSMDGSAIGLGTVVLGSVKPFDLKLPKKNVDRFLISQGSKLLGDGAVGPLPLVGTGAAYIVKGGRSELDVNFKPPPPVSGYGSASTVLRTDNDSGLKVGVVKFAIDVAELGNLPLRNLEFEVDLDSGAWYAGVAIEIPSYFKIEARRTAERPYDGLAWSPTTGVTGGAEVDFSGIGGIAMDPFQVIRLQRVAFAFNQDHPFLIYGNGDVTAGPEIFQGVAAVSSSSCAFYAVPESGDTVNVPSCAFAETFNGTAKLFRLYGDLSVVGIPLSSGFVELRNYDITFEGNLFDFHCCYLFGAGTELASATGRISGGFYGVLWQIDGLVQGCITGLGCADAGAVASDRGFGLCLPPFSGPVWGVLGWHWGGDISVYPYSGCGELNNYTSALPLFGKFSQAGTRTLRVPRGRKTVNVRAIGAGGVPRLALIGPQGQRIETPTSSRTAVGDGLAAYAVPGLNTVFFGIRNAAAGDWKLERLPGSPAVSKVDTSIPVKPKVRARVSGRGLVRKLTYTIAGVAPRQVVFAEEGGGRQSIGRARRRRGSLRFVPADGRPGRRRILALVGAGAQQVKLTVGRYTASKRALSARPRRLRIRRRGNGLRISWARSPGALRYQVRVSLSNGRRVERVIRARKLVVKGVPNAFSASATVRTLRQSGRPGPAARARLRARRR